MQSTYNNIISEYNNLLGKKVSRKDIEKLFETANLNQVEPVAFKLNQLLLNYPLEMGFDFKKVTRLEHFEGFEALGIPYISTEQECSLGSNETDGLGKPISNDDIYKMITNKFIKIIDETDNLPWSAGFNNSGDTSYTFSNLPTNYQSGKTYRGINALVLSMYRYHTEETRGMISINERGEIEEGITEMITDDRLFWLTFKQIKEEGGKLIKGSLSQQAVYYNFIHTYQGKKITDKKYNELKAKMGCAKNHSPECSTLRKTAFLKYYNVFNERDIENIDFEAKREKLKAKERQFKSSEKRILAADLVLKNMPKKPTLRIEHLNFDHQSPHYNPNSDTVVMPQKTQFDQLESWYGIAFHEHIHATGHEKRTNRRQIKGFERGKQKYDSQYAIEELVAEIGAIFLNAESGIMLANLKNNASYIQGWSKGVKKELQEDHKAIFKAAGQSQKAADYILNRDENGDPAYWKEYDKLVKEIQGKGKKQSEEKENKKQTKKAKVKAPSTKEIESDIVNHLLKGNITHETAEMVVKGFFNTTGATNLFEKYEAVKNKKKDIETFIEIHNNFNSVDIDRIIRAVKFDLKAKPVKKEINIPTGDTMTLEQLQNLGKEIQVGNLTPEEILKSYDLAIENKAPICAEINRKHTIKQLQKFSWHETKKADLVDSYFDHLIQHFNLYRNVSYVWGEDRNKVFRNGIAAITQKDIDNYVTEVIEAAKEREKSKKNFKESIQDPKTLEQFETFLRVKDLEHLTSDQLALYDKLVTEKKIKEQELAKKQKTKVQKVDVSDLELEIKKTVHSKTGDDLFVVVPSSRVSKEDYYRLLNAAKSLGGYYSRFNKFGAIAGFQFKELEKAEKFTKITSEDQEKEVKPETLAQRHEKFLFKALKRRSDAKDQIDQPRKMNTAKRLREGNSVIASNEKIVAETLIIEELIKETKKGNLLTLKNVSTFTQFELLIQILAAARSHYHYRVIDPKERKDDYNYDLKDYIIYANYPVFTMSKQQLEDVYNTLKDLKGFKLIAKRILKAAIPTNKEKSIFQIPTRLLNDLDKGIKKIKKTDYWIDHTKTEILNYKRINQQLNIVNYPMLRHTLRELEQIKQKVKPTFTAEEIKAKQIKKLEQEFIGKKISGFFPTPTKLVKKILDHVDIQLNESVLEPSAGLGHIAEEIRKEYPENELKTIEYHTGLAELLKLKGFDVENISFLDYNTKHDVIVMNPPFENLQDIDHVMHAFKLLNTGGRLVSIMANNKQGSRAKVKEFRNFVNENGYFEDIEAGSFKSSFRATGVNTVLVVLEKPEEPKKEPRKKIKITYVGKKGSSTRESRVRSFINEAFENSNSVREFETYFGNLFRDYNKNGNAFEKGSKSYFKFQQTDVEGCRKDDPTEMTKGYIVYSSPKTFRVICKIEEVKAHKQYDDHVKLQLARSKFPKSISEVEGTLYVSRLEVKNNKQLETLSCINDKQFDHTVIYNTSKNNYVEYSGKYNGVAYDILHKTENTPVAAEPKKKKEMKSDVKVDQNGQTALFGAKSKQLKYCKKTIQFLIEKHGVSADFIRKSVRGVRKSGQAGEIAAEYNRLTNSKIAPAVIGLNEASKVPEVINNTLVSKINTTSQNNDLFIIDGDIGAFLGEIERKPVGSVACTIDAEQGAGKTRFLFQVANELAKRYKVLFISLEEHPQSKLFQDKVSQYIEDDNIKNIDTIGDIEKGKEKSTLNRLVPDYDVILVDSWNKIYEAAKLDFDTDLRTAYNGKLIFAIFQRTVTGSMRGGAKAQFDGDIIMKGVKGEDFKTNTIIHNKNRYQSNDLTKLKYNVYNQALARTIEEPAPVSQNEAPIKKTLSTWDDATIYLN